MKSNYSITQNGKPLAKSKYTIDEEAKTFSTTEDDLVLDFSDLDAWVFKTGSWCTFKTGSECTFDTRWYCTFDTRWGCTFDTWEGCVIVRRDTYEVIELNGTKKIKLNGCGEAGYTVIEDEPKEDLVDIGKGVKVSQQTIGEALKFVAENAE